MNTASLARSAVCAALALIASGTIHAEERERARDIGVEIGILSPGEHNAITDVEGVKVGHVTLIDDERGIRTGATAILPHGGNLYQDKVPAGVFVGNGFGKLMGITQIRELGEIETPIVLTNTLNVPEAASAIIGWTLEQPGNESVRSVNAIVGETNDGRINDIRSRALTPDTIRQSILDAEDGPVAEGTVGAGTGTVAFRWKGGIGTSSRRLPEELGGHTVGVLVQSNYGGVLMVDGVRVGEALRQFYLREHTDKGDADGSIMIVVATDAPLSDRNLERLAARAIAGLARTGASMSNGSGDYVISFSTAESVRRTTERRTDIATIADLPNRLFSPLSQATIEATEEAILNSLFMATSPANSQYQPIPLDRVKELIAD